MTHSGPSLQRLSTGSHGRFVGALLAALLIVAPVTLVGMATSAAAAPPTVVVSVDGERILAGETGTVTLRATNSGGNDGYNLAFYLDLPVGVEYVSGSSPLGDPVVFDDTSAFVPTGMQRWVWEDVSDLPPGGHFESTVGIRPLQPALGNGETPDLTVNPVGADVVIVANAALSGDPRYLPVFDGSSGTGGAAAQAETGEGSQSLILDIVSLLLDKSEPSPERELLRGVHDQSTEYTLTVRNTTQGPTDNAVLVDFLPAGLEFLACGAVDNSTVDRDSADGTINEYAGAPGLDATPTVPASVCSGLTSVSTVVATAADATSYGVTEGAVYTRVEWDLGTVAAGDTITIRYRAGIPLFANTLTWDGVGGEPTGVSLEQAANLDNNNGPSTRQGSASAAEDGQGLTNHAGVSGDYQGMIRSGTQRQVQDAAEVTVTAMDLALLKDTDDSTFEHDKVTTFTLRLRTGEYASAADIRVTDTIPNGLCPLLPADVTLVTEPGAVVGPGCEALGNVTGAVIESAKANLNGTFTVVFRPVAGGGNPDDFELAPNSDNPSWHVITYTTRDNVSYVDNGDVYGETTSGDSFGNTAEVEGSTTSIPELNSTNEPLLVWDDSAVTLETELTEIVKKTLRRSEVTPDLGPGINPCSGKDPSMWEEDASEPFRLGDIICFELVVDFPDSVHTRNPMVTDFLPEGLSYLGHEVASSGWTPGTDVVDTTSTADNRVSFVLGAVGDGGDRYVAPGRTFVAHVWAEVLGKGTDAVWDKPENLMKYRQQNVNGELFFLRDQAPFEVEGGLGLTKGVQQVQDNLLAVQSNRTAGQESSPDGLTFGSNRDDIEVAEGEKVTYRIDLTAPAFTVGEAEIWDLLPAGIAAADVSGISDGGQAYDPSDVGYPAGMSVTNSSRSVIIWTGIVVPEANPPMVMGKTLTYDVTVPVGTGVSTTLDNTASTIRYSSDTNSTLSPHSYEYVVEGSLDDDASALANVSGQGKADDSAVYLAAPSVAKSVTSPTTMANNASGEVVKGEMAVSGYSVTIPARTTVKNAIFSDAIANAAGNWQVVPGATVVRFPNGNETGPGFSGTYAWGGQNYQIDPTAGSVAFPSTYSNTTNSNQIFTVFRTAYIVPGSTWTHTPGTGRNNTATFTSDTGGDFDTAGVVLIEPDPSIVKVVNDDSVVAGQMVTYTLTATNAAGRPTLFDAVAVDCVPGQLTDVVLGVASQGTAALVPDASCDGTRIVWDLGSLAGDGTGQTLEYMATVSPSAAGGATYTNIVALSGFTLDDPLAPRAEHVVTTSESVTVLGAGTTKTVDQPTAVVGQERTYTVSATIPADVNFYDAFVVDTLPSGMGSPTSVTVTCVDSNTDPCVGVEVVGEAMTPVGSTHGWWFGDIVSHGNERTITITYTTVVLDEVAVSDGDHLDNTARLRWNTTNVVAVRPDANATTTSATPSAEARVTVQEPDLGVVKKVNSLDADTVEPGETFGYTVQVTNSGTSTAYDVTVVDDVPQGVVVDSSSISGSGMLTGADPVRGGGIITWTLSSLAVGAGNAVMFSYSAVLEPSTTIEDLQTFTNTVEIEEYFSHPGGSTSGYDNAERRRYTGGDDTAQVTPLFPRPQVVKATTTGTTAYVGEDHTFTLTVTNTGTGVATAVTVTDVLPAGWTYVPNSAVMSVGSNQEPDITGQTLTWDVLPDLAASGVLTITYDAVPAASYTWSTSNTGAGYAHTNEAVVTVEDADGYTGNADRDYEDDSEEDVYIHRANLDLDKEHTGAIVAGQNTTWTLTVTNNGPDAALGPIVITDQLPDDADYLTFSGVGWSTTGVNANNELTLTHPGPLAAGSPLTVSITASFADDVPAATDADNSACVAARTYDPDLLDNCAQDTGDVVTLADLELVKSLTATAYTAGQDISWELDVTNHGPSISLSPISIQDTLPVGVDLDTVTGTGTGWSCGTPVTATRIVTCTYTGANLGVGDDLPTLTLTATVLSGTTGTLLNSATVFPTTDEPSSPGTTNNTDTAVTGPGNASADLELTKTIASTDLVVGGQGRYRVAVHNDGPSDAVNVVVTDSLPSGVTYAAGLTSSAGDTWSCLPDGNDPETVTCTLTSNAGVVVAGDTVWFEFDVDIASSLTGPIANSAVVTSDTPDPDPTNNDDAISRTPTTQTNLSLSKSHDTSRVYRVGDEVTFTITVFNWGLADARDVVVEDTLPDDVTFVRTENDTGWTVSGPTAGVLRFELQSPMPAGSAITPVTRSIDVVVELTADSVPTVTNEALVETSTPETTDTDNSDDDTVPVYSPDLEIAKSASASITEGGASFSYTLSVRNVDLMAHADQVVVTDAIPADVRVITAEASIGGVLWDCMVSGRDAQGYGGTLTCELATLAADSMAPDIQFTVQVNPLVARDAIPNVAEVSSTDEHVTKVDSRNEADVSVAVRWINFSGASVCRADVPYFEYTIDPRNLGNGQTITLAWYPDADADGTADGPLVATQTLPTTTAGVPITSEILWPGAAVDSHGVGIAWPGWRTALAGETPVWENQVEDPTLLEHVLRAGALVTVSINPEASVSVGYPPQDSGCMAPRDPVLDVDKTTPRVMVDRAQRVSYSLVATNTSYGATNDVVLRDEVPAQLKVVDVVPAVSSDPTIANWQPCTVTGQDAEGYGGVVECVLDGWIGYGQTAPAVEVVTTIRPNASLGAVTNVAIVQWTDPDGVVSGAMTADDDAMITLILSAEELLALTGLTGSSLAIVAVALLAVGVLVVVTVRRRES